MSISQLSAAAVNASLEIEPALTKLNFDFSLWKVTAPKEFEGVRAALKADRREEAENGTPHKTARKLAALFERLILPTPKLIRAYGQRDSEVSQFKNGKLLACHTNYILLLACHATYILITRMPHHYLKLFNETFWAVSVLS
jgi:hypothetical protein